MNLNLLKENKIKTGLRFLQLLIVSVVLLPYFGMMDVRAGESNDKIRNRAQKAMREGEFETAVKLYHDVLTKNARDIDARLGLSYTLYKQRNYLDAFDHAARAISQEPLSARGHALLGAIILATGDFRRSVEEFRTALVLKEDEALAVAGLAMVDYYENRVSDCLAGLRRATFLDPNEPDFIFSMGQAAARSERYKEAADAYEKFLRVSRGKDTDRRDVIRGLIGFLRYLGTQRTLYDASGDNQTSLKIEIPEGRPILEVRINDHKEPLRFVLDTGSGMSVISEETAERLGIKPVARGGRAGAVGGGGKFEIVYGFLQSLEIGDARIQNVPVYIRKFYSAGKPADGYLGIAAISDFVATLDYKAKTFSLLRRKDSNSVKEALKKTQANTAKEFQPPAITVPTRLTSSGLLSAEVNVQGVEEPLNFIVDTGASITVISSRLAEREEIGQYLQRNEFIKLFGAAGIAENTPVLLLPKLSFGAHAREGVKVVAVNLDTINETTGFQQAGILGTNFLNHFRVTFDFRGSVVILELNTKPDSKSENTTNKESVW